MDGKFYIKKFVRDDGAVLELDARELFLAEENDLLMRSSPETTALEYTGADGGEMVHQRGATYEQTLQGLIVPKTSSWLDLAQRLGDFFQINHTYDIVYIGKGGEQYAQRGAWISEGLQVPPSPHEDYSYWTITLTVGRTAIAQYAEDDEGAEIPANNVTVPIAGLGSGGEVWGSVGEVWDSVGTEWAQGQGGDRTIYIASSRSVYPTWKVEGPCQRPQITNRNNGSSAYFDGAVSAGQTLVVDFADGSARLDGSTVSRYLNGLLYLSKGQNTLTFTTDGGDAESSEIGWNNSIN